jgi:hypothetical protein
VTVITEGGRNDVGHSRISVFTRADGCPGDANAAWPTFVVAALDCVLASTAFAGGRPGHPPRDDRSGLSMPVWPPFV